MPKIVTIVEGHGEVEAVPVLLRRIVEAVAPNANVEVTPPIRVDRYKIVKPTELERAIELAARIANGDGCVLVLLDAEDDCPAELGPDLLRRASGTRPDRAIRVVLAKREYEAWFVAAVTSIVGLAGISEDARAPEDAEGIRDAKRWLTRHMPEAHSYRPTRHQALLTRHFDLDTARRGAPSFDKLWRDLSTLLIQGDV